MAAAKRPEAAAASAFALLPGFDVAGPFQIRNQIIFRKILSGPDLFGGGIDSRGTREDFPAQEVVYAFGQDDPVVGKDSKEEYGADAERNDDVGL